MSTNSNFALFWEASTLLCDFLQFPQNLTEKGYRCKLVVLVLEVYKAGMLLPETDNEGDDELNDDHLDEKVSQLELAFENELGDVDYYLESYDPFNFKEDTLINASLIEELKDIFRRLKVQLLKLETKEDMWIKDAEWSIEFYLNLSLLNELIDVSRALHYSMQIDD